MPATHLLQLLVRPQDIFYDKAEYLDNYANHYQPSFWKSHIRETKKAIPLRNCLQYMHIRILQHAAAYLRWPACYKFYNSESRSMSNQRKIPIEEREYGNRVPDVSVQFDWLPSQILFFAGMFMEREYVRTFEQCQVVLPAPSKLERARKLRLKWWSVGNAEGAYTTQVPGLPIRNSSLFNLAGLKRTVSEHHKIAGEPRNWLRFCCLLSSYDVQSKWNRRFQELIANRWTCQLCASMDMMLMLRKRRWRWRIVVEHDYQLWTKITHWSVVRRVQDES